MVGCGDQLVGKDMAGFKKNHTFFFVPCQTCHTDWLLNETSALFGKVKFN